MPILHLQLCPPQPAARLRALANSLVQLSTEVLGKRAAVTALRITQSEPDSWAIGFEPPSGPIALLDIRISQGSNTPAQKARFVALAHAAMHTHLGQVQPLAEASYVSVLEVPGEDWGYGGLTQAARRAGPGHPGTPG